MSGDEAKETAAEPAVEAAPAKKEPMGDGRKFLTAAGVILGLAAVVFGIIVERYGFVFFLSKENKSNHFTDVQVEAMLRNHTVLFVGGPHRGGTTILWKKLREHPQIAGFGDRVGADLSEGIFMQTVYPQFGIGNEVNAGRMVNMAGKKREHETSVLDTRGLGRYMFNPNAHLTEESPLVDADSRTDLFNEWSYFWPLHDAGQPVLMEKSPPNMMTSRFLQALFAVPDSDVRFVFITRHPIANALAHYTWQTCRTQSMFELVLHWVTGHEMLVDDMPLLKNAKLLRFEDFATKPQETMRDLYAWLGLENPDFYGEDKVKSNTNDKYKVQYCETLKSGIKAQQAHARLVKKLGAQVTALGYDLEEYNCLKADDGEENMAATLTPEAAEALK